MPKDKLLTLSIIIPVYNEQDCIKTCLDSVARQTVKPDEVIVVNNGSTDRTVEIAKEYEFVKLIEEPVKGLTRARDTGFRAAKGEIFGRIDADTILTPNWVEKVKSDFSDPEVMGVSGLALTNVMWGLDNYYSKFWSRVYFWTAHALFRAHIMWGANMALRRSSWLKVRHYLQKDGKIVHEDQDISLAIAGHGGKLVHDNDLLIKTASRGTLYWPKFWHYFIKCFTTKNYHKQKGTYSMTGARFLKFWQIIPEGIVGWTLTGLFIVFAFVSWPLFIFIGRFSKNPRKYFR